MKTPTPGERLRETLAKVKEAPASDVRFHLADQIEIEADRKLDRTEASAVKACLTQFRITGGVRHLEACLDKLERAVARSAP